MSWYKQIRLIVVTIIISLTSCGGENTFNNYLIPFAYRQLIASYREGDTLKFKDSKENIELYLVQKIDSSEVLQNNGWMRSRGWKEIRVSCRELTNTRPGYEVYDMITLNKYADADSATMDVRLRNFYTIDESKPFVLKSDTVRANDIAFNNYYLFYSGNLKDVTDPYVVSQIYITPGKGIIAYKMLNGNWWTRCN